MKTDQELKHSAWDQVKHELTRQWPCDRWNCLGIVVGCSGGADSVALLRLLAEILDETPAKGFLVAAHFNHALRGSASDGDAQFVQTLADDLNVRFTLARGSGQASDEAHLRLVRRDFLRQTANQHGCRYVALAHSQDDNVETVLHHLFRGSGPRGLAGISPSRTYGQRDSEQDLVLIRPLLTVSRSLIRDAMRERGFSWREDESNTDERYRRNWIRRTLLPLIESQFPEAGDAVSRAAESQRDLTETLDDLASIWMETFVARDSVSIQRQSRTGQTLTDHALSRSSIIVAAMQRIWRQNQWPLGAMTRSHWSRLVETIVHPDGRGEAQFQLPGNVWCVPGDRQIVLEKRDSQC